MQSSEQTPQQLSHPKFVRRKRGRRTGNQHHRQQSSDQAAASIPRVAIQAIQDERRPFELGDLLTRAWIARNSSFLVSLILHLLLILVLSIVLIHGTGKAMILLEMLDSSDIEELDGVAIGQNDEDVDDSIDADEENLLTQLFAGEELGSPLIDAGHTSRTPGGGSRGTDDGDGQAAKFFGMRATGKSFVYVLDRSGSMGSQSSISQEQPITRFDIARNELLSSIEELNPDQEFYVVLFSTKTRRMFDDSSALPRPVKATSENKKRFKDWLATTTAGGGTDPRRSLKLALELKPDAIFMLSDGAFSNENTPELPPSLEIVREYSSENVPIQINSIAFEDESSKLNMEALSKLSGGAYKFIAVEDQIELLIDTLDDTQRLIAISYLARKAIAPWERIEQLAST